MQPRPLLATFASLLFLAVAARAEMYRWEDAEGKVHFSDSAPPPGARNARSVGSSSATAPAPAADPEQRAARERGRKLVEVLQEERRAAEIAREQADAEAAAQAARCERLRAERVAAQHARYLYRDGEQGEREVLSRGERADYERELADLEADTCVE